MILKISILCFVFLFDFLQTAVCQSKIADKDGQWISIFNGKNLDGWTPKVTGFKAGENPLNGFRVEDGILKVDYSKFAAFNNHFGHLFYKENLSDYILRVEYRFHGELLPDAPGYCYRNSGVMVHSQSPESMDILQNWPVSLEAQLLGSTEKHKQLTANICTPGTTISYKGAQSEEHCINSTSKYYYDNQWVTLDIIVHGGKSVYHVIDGDTVLAYSNPQIGGMLLTENYPVPSGTLLEDGYIALQAEGTPIDFRNIKLKILDDKKVSGKKTEIPPKPVELKVVDNYDNYATSEELSKNWYQPRHGGRATRNLDPNVKGGGKYSLRCDYETEKSDANFYVSFCRVDKWDLSGCNGVQFWFKPDGLGREFTIEFNIADKNGKNIHDLWGYKYKTEKGDTAPRWVSVPFFSLVHNTKFADSPDVSLSFKPDAVIEVAIYIGGRNDEPGKGTFYFDELAGTKLQF